MAVPGFSRDDPFDVALERRDRRMLARDLLGRARRRWRQLTCHALERVEDVGERTALR